MPVWEYIDSTSSTLSTQSEDTNYHAAIPQGKSMIDIQPNVTDCSLVKSNWNPGVNTGLFGNSNVENLHTSYNQRFQVAKNIEIGDNNISLTTHRHYFVNMSNEVLPTSDSFPTQQYRALPLSPPLSPVEIEGILESVLGNPFNLESGYQSLQVPQPVQSVSCYPQIVDLEENLVMDEVITASQNHTTDARRSSSDDSDSSAEKYGLRKGSTSFDLAAGKDEVYWQKRRKNNKSAKKSRDTKRIREQIMQQKVIKLEAENEKLKKELAALKEENAKLRATVDVDDKLSSSEDSS